MRPLLSAAVLAVAALCASVAFAQSWPSRAVTLIVPYAPGGSVDAVARFVVPKLQERLAQTVVVDNVAGAGGVIGTQKAANASADGYTLLFSVESTMVIAKLVTPSTVKYDGLKDFAPISLVGTSPLVLVGKPDLPAKNAAELAQLLRSQPGKFNYATSGIGTSLHLGGELINQAARVNMVHVPYKVGAQIVTDVSGNQIELAVLPLVMVQQAVKAGRMRAYGVTDTARWPTAMDIPSLAEQQEFKGVDVLVWYGLFAPAKTDPAIVNRLAREMDAVLKDPEIARRMGDLALKPANLSPAQFGVFLQKEHDKFAAIVKSANIKAE
ncbi:MAG: tripartite tricarboxylate transporter substrate binding protein [Betaproteobacteria bacterium]|nr:tripartite tricarboxylate transporter substrate binding protein [Betaproteobacteria bacterium]